MPAILMSILAFAVALGILVTVHEFGHFWVARRMGVKVLRFSFGFGKPLLRWVRGSDRTEYVISALPLGGYVKMLDNREGTVPAVDRDREYTGKPLYARFAIVFAGPLFNFIFAFLAYWLIFVIGITGTKPVVGEVSAGSLAAHAGIQVGQTITRIDGTRVQTWEQMMSGLMYAAVEGHNVDVETESSQYGIPQHRVLDLGDLQDVEPAGLMQKIGMGPATPKWPTLIAQVTANSPAQRGGLRVGDRITQIDAKPVDDWYQVVEAIRSHPGQAVKLTVKRGEGQQLIELSVTPESKLLGQQRIGFLGVAPQAPSKAELQTYTSREHYGIFGAASHALSKVAEMSRMSLTLLGRMLMGSASLENLSGPITIADYAGKPRVSAWWSTSISWP